MSMYRVDPRIRAHGKARIDITRRAKDEQDWQRMWKEPRYAFPFTLGQPWKQAFLYTVDDYAAEIGFFIDVLGLPVYAFSTSCALFTSPDFGFAFGVAAAGDCASTPPDSVRVQFMVSRLLDTIEELERRGIQFESRPVSGHQGDAGLISASFRTPHGVLMELLAAPELAWDQPAASLTPAVEEEETSASLDLWRDFDESTSDETLFSGETGEPEAGTAGEEVLSPDELPDLPEFLASEVPEGKPVGQAALPDLEKAPDPVENKAARPNGNGNGSGTWKRVEPRPNGAGRAGARQPDLFPRTSSLRRGGQRSNGELRPAGANRRPGTNGRRNPFDTRDLPPLPDVPGFSSPAIQDDAPAGLSDQIKRDPEAEVDRQDFLFPQGRKSKPAGEVPRPAGPVEAEPQYEDLEESEGPAEFDDFFS